MAENTKILFTDLDGTLLNDKKEITAGNQQAIHKALAQGHKIVVCTGRPLASGIHIAQRLGLTREGCYVIGFNGAQIYDAYHKKTVYGKAIPVDTARDLFREALERGIHVQSYSEGEVLALKETPELLYYMKRTTVTHRIVPDVESAIPQDPYKLLLIGLNNRQELEKYQKECVEPLKGRVHSFFSNENYLEVVAGGISKGIAVKWLCDYLDIPLENSVAAGDAPNDVDMLKAAHIGAVMCNAHEEIAQYGDYVTKQDNNHDGVAEIMEQFILNK